MYPRTLARKIGVGAAGGIILIAGIISIVIPTPASVLLPLGLMILATEFVIIRDLIKKSRQRINRNYCGGNRKGSTICKGLNNVLAGIERDGSRHRSSTTGNKTS